MPWAETSTSSIGVPLSASSMLLSGATPSNRLRSAMPRSVSTISVRAPSCEYAIARLSATVLLPTPPLPPLTAIARRCALEDLGDPPLMTRNVAAWSVMGSGGSVVAVARVGGGFAEAGAGELEHARRGRLLDVLGHGLAGGDPRDRHA